jgi:hypothetical protein
VAPDGTLRQLRVIRHELTALGADTSSFQALDAEALRVMSSLRFGPETRPDTVTIPLTFRIE